MVGGGGGEGRSVTSGGMCVCWRGGGDRLLTGQCRVRNQEGQAPSRQCSHRLTTASSEQCGKRSRRHRSNGSSVLTGLSRCGLAVKAPGW